MIVCLCEGLSDRQLRTTVREGACTRFELSRQTGAGTHCGSCRCDLREIVRSEVASMERTADEGAPSVIAK